LITAKKFMAKIVDAVGVRFDHAIEAMVFKPQPALISDCRYDSLIHEGAKA
jgi:hypothetical protein